MEKKVKIVFVSDLHYTTVPNLACPERKGEYIPKFLACFIRKCNREIHPDLVLCGGDLINDPKSADAECLTENLAGLFSLLDMPCCVIRGNHDLPQEKFTRYFPFHETTDIDFVRILAFDDPETPGYNAVRTSSDCAGMIRNLQEWDGIAFSFQHTPLLEPGKCIYNYENTDSLLAEFRKNHCKGTLSGHYHTGIPLHESNQLQFFVQHALCEAPFSFSVLEITMQGIQKVIPMEIPG